MTKKIKYGPAHQAQIDMPGIGRGNHPNSKKSHIANLKKHCPDPSLSPLKHGADAGTVKARFSDKNTAEGHLFLQIQDCILEDLGGDESLGGFQRLILAAMRPKLMALISISLWIDEQPDLMKEEDLIPVLKERYQQLTGSLDRDIKTLISLVEWGEARRIKTLPSIEDIIRQSQEEDS